MKKFASFAITIVSILGLSACSSDSPNAEVISTMPATTPIFFSSNSDAVSPMGIEKTTAFVRLHREDGNRKGFVIYLYGFADAKEKGADALSERRIEAVKKVLLDQVQVAEWRIRTKSYGSSYPMADNATAAGRAKNRRVIIAFEP